MACGGCAKKREERAALREQRIAEKRQAQAEAAAEQKSLTASAQK